MYKVFLSINNNEDVVCLPCTPPGIGPKYPQHNGEYEGLSGDYNVIGPMGLWTMSISSFFPVGKRYPWMPAESESDGWKYVDFFARNRPRKLPFRIVILDNDGVSRLNSACTVDSFSWSVNRRGDIDYTLELREYRFVSGVR